MNYHLRSIFIIFLSSFMFVSNVIAQEASSDSLNRTLLRVVQSGDDTAAMEHVEYLLRSGVDVNVSDEFGRTAVTLAAVSGNTNIVKLLLNKGGGELLCYDYIIDVDVHPEYSDPDPGQSMTINLHNGSLELLDSVGSTVTGNIIRLELVFSLRQRADSTALVRVTGIGESKNFQGSFKVNLVIDNGVDEHSANTVEDVIRQAVRHGYEQLRNSLGLRQQLLRSTVSQVGGGNTMLVPLGTSDNVRMEDVFYIYPGEDYNNYDSCNIARHADVYLTTARVIEINDDQSIMEWDPIQNEHRSVQPGDIVELDPNIDLVSRRQGNEPLDILQMGSMPDIYVRFINTDGQRIITRYATSHIKQILFKEARNFNFRLRDRL